jgi:hypothetical protein
LNHLLQADATFTLQKENKRSDPVPTLFRDFDYMGSRADLKQHPLHIAWHKPCSSDPLGAWRTNDAGRVGRVAPEQRLGQRSRATIFVQYDTDMHHTSWKQNAAG